MALTGFLLFTGPALSAELTYTPVNPSFGGNPLNSSHLISTANAQRTATASDANSSISGSSSSSSSSSTSADLFVRQLEGRLLSALASQVTEAIFGDNPQDSGTVTFGDTEISFNRGVDSITLSITDFTDGTVTNIEVPVLVSN
ncbi:curli assembly protein CsgG [Cohaesibacter celericrescens]|uniref:Curli production assembly/transport component CsgF n=1 Tax=Cohaesibacter celericrescens TaxID=2067669 RepID=A0A2N5XT99_9HYPH|nr:curli assembly protein CsgG [Cohaesibacter celericrescens]